MKALKLIITALALLGVAVTGQAKDFDDSKLMHKEFPGWFLDNTFLDLSDAVTGAKAEGKKGLMVVFNTKGCSYCALFNDKSLANPEIAAKLQKNFDSVGMEIFDDTEMVSPTGQSLPVKQFAKQEGVQFSPTILFYDETGKQVFRKTGYQSPERFTQILDFVEGGHYNKQSLSQFIDSQKQQVASVGIKAPLIDNPIFEKPPYALDRSHYPAQKPMVVLFEKQGCAECSEFHELVLGDKDVMDILKGFTVVRLDSHDDKTPLIAPDGSKTTPAKWYERYDFSRSPALLFIDYNGNVALNTDALVLRQRMMNSLSYMLEKAYEKGWTYQRFARTKAIARSLAKQSSPAVVTN